MRLSLKSARRQIEGQRTRKRLLNSPIASIAESWPGGVRDNRYICEILAPVEGLIAVKIRRHPPRLVFAEEFGGRSRFGGTYLVAVLGKVPCRNGEVHAMGRQLGGAKRKLERAKTLERHPSAIIKCPKQI
jgi:hypothetical protein